MQLISISSWQRHLFRREILDWSAIGIRTSIDRLFKAYNLSPAAEVGTDSTGRVPIILGAGGEFLRSDTRHTIEQLAIDPVALQFQITGDTAAADAFYNNLLETIESTAQTKIDRSGALARTIQTITVAKMAMDPWRFYSNEWKQFLQTKVEPIVGIEGASHSIAPNSFSFMVKYRRELTDYQLSPKPFVIEPRVGMLDSDIFFAVSPTDSTRHISLIEELERTFRKGE